MEENLASIEIEEMIQDDTVPERNFSSKVTIDGKEVHKASVTRHPVMLNEVQDDVDLDNCIMIVAVSVSYMQCCDPPTERK